jgi:hypothetical protein
MTTSRASRRGSESHASSELAEPPSTAQTALEFAQTRVREQAAAIETLNTRLVADHERVQELEAAIWRPHRATECV